MFIPIPCHFYTQPFHTHYMPRSCQTHHSQFINHFTHAYSLISCFNIAIQPDRWQTLKSREENRTQTLSRPTLAQAKRFSRSSELLSTRRGLEKGTVALSRSLA